MEIHKAVVPVAGMGTRLHPTTRALPKEMLPVGRQPTIQHVVDELAAADLTNLLFITTPAKAIIQQQFDDASKTDGNGKASGLTYDFAEQQTPQGWSKPGGTGAAIAMAETFVGEQHFVVAYGDTIIKSSSSPVFLERMVAIHQRVSADVTICVRPVPEAMVPSYGIVRPAHGQDSTAEYFVISDIVEKPPLDRAPSNLAVSARYIFSPDIFPHIHRLGPAEDTEVDITDAIRTLVEEGGKVCCVPLARDEIRYDIGSHEGYFKAFIDFALEDPDCGDAIRNYLDSVTSGSSE